MKIGLFIVVFFLLMVGVVRAEVISSCHSLSGYWSAFGSGQVFHMDSDYLVTAISYYPKCSGCSGNSQVCIYRLQDLGGTLYLDTNDLVCCSQEVFPSTGNRTYYFCYPTYNGVVLNIGEYYGFFQAKQVSLGAFNMYGTTSECTDDPLGDAYSAPTSLTPYPHITNGTVQDHAYAEDFWYELHGEEYVEPTPPQPALPVPASGYRGVCKIIELGSSTEVGMIPIRIIAGFLNFILCYPIAFGIILILVIIVSFYLYIKRGY